MPDTPLWNLKMAASARSRPRAVEIHIHDDHSHKETPSGTATSALGELPLNNIHNLKSRSSIESLAHRLDNFHIYSSDKENKSRLTVEPVSRVPSATLSAKDIPCVHPHDEAGAGANAISVVSEVLDENNPLAVASQRLPSTKEQLSKHQEATRIKGEEDFAMAIDAEIAKLQSTTADRLCLSDAPMAEHYLGSDMLKSPGLVLDVKEVAEDSDGDGSRPLSQIEDSGEALEKLEEEIGALGQVAQLEQVLSPEATTRNTNGSGAKPTPMKGATSGRAGATPTRARTVERASSVHRPTSTGNDEKTAPGSATSSARKVPRPTSLLPPKPPAKSSKAPTVPTFELPGEAVARRLKEQREQRRSQQVSSEQAAALAAAYSPSKPHFKSTKPPTRPTFELPGEAISRKKREEREAKLRAQEEEERKRREFKARPIRASLVPNTIPRETRTSLVRQKSRTTEGSSDSATTTITPVSKKRHSLVGASGTPAATTSATFHSRGRNPDSTNNATATTSRRAHSTTPSQASIHSRSSGRSKQTGDEVAAASVPPHKPLRGKEVYARDNAVREERERERREREQAARVAREKAAERSREMSRLWAEKQRLKREMEMRTEKMAEQVPERERAC